MLKYRPIRKSAYTSYLKCQKKFEYMYNSDDYFSYGLEEAENNEALRRGNRFHDGCDQFFRNIEGKIKTPGLPSTFRDLLPIVTDERDLIVNEWFDWFAEKEKERYIELDESNKLGYFFPIATELEIRLPDTIDRTGHVDRIDIIPGTKELQIVEYKTGKSYNMDNQYAVTDMNQEIGFYIQIINTANIFPNNKITEWKVINPTLKRIWVNRISPISLRTVERKYKEITDKVISKDKFPRNMGVQCKHCPFERECMDSYFEEEYEPIKI